MRIWVEPALRAVFSLSGSEVPANVLMITDGEIWDIDGVITACRHAGVRVFIIGVGLSPAESNLRLLAEATGGAVEFLSPSESTEAAVGRQLNRMRQPIITNAKLEIPGEPKWIVPNPADTHLYAGDTVHFWYETKGIEAEDQASLILDDYRSTKFSVQTSTVENNEESSELARLAVAARLKAWDTKKASNEEINNYTELAVQYQLVTSKTNFLMIEDRGENQAMDLPDTRAVKHMIRADIASFSCASAVSCHAYDSTTVSESFSEYLEVPAFLRRQAYDQPDESISGVIEEPGREGQLSGSDCSAINAYFNFYEELPLSASGSHGLERIALTDESISELTKLLALSISEESVLLAFWNAILQTPVKRELQREVIWWIKHQRAMTSPEKNLCDSMVKHLADSECHLVKWDTDCADALFEAYKSRLFSRRFSAF